MGTKAPQRRLGVVPLTVLLLAGSGLAFPATSRAATTARTKRVSLSSDGAEGNAMSDFASIDGDGRLVAFESDASNLVAGDTNAFTDIFVRNRRTGRTRRVSVSSSGGEGNFGSYFPAISADGRLVAFESAASNLVGSDTNGHVDVFVRDRKTGRTRRVSISTDGVEGNQDSSHAGISADGRFVTFSSLASNLIGTDTNADIDVFVRDRTTGRTRRVSISTDRVEGNAASYNPSISGDGRFVAFSSDATNLVGNDTNGQIDIFVRGPLS